MSWLSLAGAVAGKGIDYLLGRKQRRESPDLAGKTAHAENMQGVLGRVEAAKTAGLHPLSVLGGSFGGSGAPMVVGSDFAGAFENYQNNKTRDREFNVDMQQRRAEESRRIQADADQRALNQAQIERLNKEGNWLDEQIRASQEESVRRQTQHSGASIGIGSSNPSNTGALVQFKPNEIVHHKNGQTYGELPYRDTMQYGHETWGMLHGREMEGGEIMNNVLDAAAYAGVPPSDLIGPPELWRRLISINKGSHPLRIASDIRRLGYKRAMARARARLSGLPDPIEE